MKVISAVIALLCLLGLTQIGNKYKDENVVNDEFKNLYLNVQPIKHKVFTSTPVLSAVQDREFVIVSSGTVIRIMIRDNQEIYSINLSCVTIIR